MDELQANMSLCIWPQHVLLRSCAQATFLIWLVQGQLRNTFLPNKSKMRANLPGWAQPIFTHFCPCDDCVQPLLSSQRNKTGSIAGARISLCASEWTQCLNVFTWWCWHFFVLTWKYQGHNTLRTWRRRWALRAQHFQSKCSDTNNAECQDGSRCHSGVALLCCFLWVMHGNAGGVIDVQHGAELTVVYTGFIFWSRRVARKTGLRGFSSNSFFLLKRQCHFGLGNKSLNTLSQLTDSHTNRQPSASDALGNTVMDTTSFVGWRRKRQREFNSEMNGWNGSWNINISFEERSFHTSFCCPHPSYKYACILLWFTQSFAPKPHHQAIALTKTCF